MATELEDELGDILGKARDGKGWTQADLAKSAGMSVGDIARIENYEWVPEEKVVFKIANALDL